MNSSFQTKGDGIVKNADFLFVEYKHLEFRIDSYDCLIIGSVD